MMLLDACEIYEDRKGSQKVDTTRGRIDQA